MAKVFAKKRPCNAGISIEQNCGRQGTPAGFIDNKRIRSVFQQGFRYARIRIRLRRKVNWKEASLHRFIRASAGTHQIMDHLRVPGQKSSQMHHSQAAFTAEVRICSVLQQNPDISGWSPQPQHMKKRRFCITVQKIGIQAETEAPLHVIQRRPGEKGNCSPISAIRRRCVSGGKHRKHDENESKPKRPTGKNGSALPMATASDDVHWILSFQRCSAAGKPGSVTQHPILPSECASDLWKPIQKDYDMIFIDKSNQKFCNFHYKNLR